jgi:hypothetical protein
MLRARMAIRFIEIKASESTETLNAEWVILENDGKTPFSTRGCGMTVGRRGSAKKSMLGIIDPGFVLHPGERMRMCTGQPNKEAHGPPPEDDTKNYFLLLPKTYLNGKGTVLTLVLRGLQVSKAEFDPEAPRGVGVTPPKKA